jgi:hypothetical protein
MPREFDIACSKFDNDFDWLTTKKMAVGTSRNLRFSVENQNATIICGS